MAHIIIASDHAGFDLKQILVTHLIKAGHNIEDLGTNTHARCDYPLYAHTVCERVLATPQSVGVLICGTGVGMSMAANRHAGIRAALCSSEFQAQATRAHNDANVLCLGERVTGSAIALAMLDAFLNTSFEGGRHTHRIELLNAPCQTSV